VIKLPVTINNYQHSKKGSFNSESSLDADDVSYYKTLELVFFDLGTARGQMQIFENMSECLGTESKLQSSDEKKHLNSATA
jgi:hypothetical protein